jgi:RimJ/RimL family protein N-acetyltransferase
VPTVSAFDPRPVVLENAFARVEPLDERHAGDLCALSADADGWRLMPRPAPPDEAAWREWIGDACSRDDVVFAIVDPRAGRAVGTTRYMSIDRPSRRLEIGWTILAPSARRTAINTATKRLLLGHAFDELGARRVELKTDGANARSRAAILRIGASFEGLFRKHRIRHDGSDRDTAWYAILDDDWPRVRARLDGLLRR